MKYIYPEDRFGGLLREVSVFVLLLKGANLFQLQDNYDVV